MDKLHLTGRYGANGEFMVYGSRDITKHGVSNKNKRIIVTIEVLDDNPKPAMISYIRKVIFPEFARGFLELGERKTIDDINSYIFCNMKSIRLECESLEELKRIELWHLIEECKQFAAEHFNIYVHDANQIVK